MDFRNSLEKNKNKYKALPLSCAPARDSRGPASGSATRTTGDVEGAFRPARLHLPAWPGGWATDERGLPPGHRLRLPPARSPGRGSREPRRRLPALRITSGEALAMDELDVERRIHSCMPRLPGMVEATAAWMPADGGVGRDWAWCYGASSDEGKSVGAPPCSGEPAGGERRGRRARARLNLGGGWRRLSGHGGLWRAQGEE